MARLVFRSKKQTEISLSPNPKNNLPLFEGMEDKYEKINEEQNEKLAQMVKEGTSLGEKKNNIKNKVVKTYTEDLLKVIGGGAGTIREIIHNQETREREKYLTSKQAKANKFLLWGSILIFLISGGLIAYYFITLEPSTVDVKAPIASLIFTDTTRYLEIDGLDKEKIAERLITAIDNSSVGEERIEGIYLAENKKTVGLSDFISRIGVGLILPKEGFIKDHFLLGITNKKLGEEEQASKHLFFLIKISEFRDAFSVMRDWENKIFQDLHPFFGIELDASVAYLLTKDWADGIIQNKNARILYDEEGEVVMMYVYADNTSIVITDSESAVHEVILRLTSSRVRR